VTIGTRFFLVGFLPTYAALFFLLVLVWALEGPGTSFKRAWKVAAGLSTTEIVLIALSVLLLSLLLAPFQLGLVRVLEGAWPAWLGGGWGTARQRARKAALEAQTVPASYDVKTLWQAGSAGYRLRQRFPLPDHLVRSTRLGNILAAMEDRAGRDYGLDAVVAWPRLYLLLDKATRAVVDDRRNTLHYRARRAGPGGAPAGAALVILWGTGWWMLLPAVPAAVSVLAYLGALRAALAYSEGVQTAFDLYHLDLGKKFGLARPDTPERERVVYRQLCNLWRQSIPPTYGYAAEIAKDSSKGKKP
jgi:hypothetical protein